MSEAENESTAMGGMSPEDAVEALMADRDRLVALDSYRVQHIESLRREIAALKEKLET